MKYSTAMKLIILIDVKVSTISKLKINNKHVVVYDVLMWCVGHIKLTITKIFANDFMSYV